MKLGKILYLFGIIIMTIMAFVMYNAGWRLLPIFLAIIIVAGLINYIDIIQNNRISISKPKSRRKSHFHSMTHEEQEKHLIELHKEVREKFTK